MVNQEDEKQLTTLTVDMIERLVTLEQSAKFAELQRTIIAQSLFKLEAQAKDSTDFILELRSGMKVAKGLWAVIYAILGSVGTLALQYFLFPRH